MSLTNREDRVREDRVHEYRVREYRVHDDLGFSSKRQVGKECIGLQQLMIRTWASQHWRKFHKNRFTFGIIRVLISETAFLELIFFPLPLANGAFLVSLTVTWLAVPESTTPTSVLIVMLFPFYLQQKTWFNLIKFLSITSLKLDFNKIFVYRQHEAKFYPQAET